MEHVCRLRCANLGLAHCLQGRRSGISTRRHEVHKDVGVLVEGVGPVRRVHAVVGNGEAVANVPRRSFL